MIKGFAASKAAKMLGLCACPVGAGVVAVQVPQIRSAIHHATAPKKAPRQIAAAKTRPASRGPQLAMANPCPSGIPVMLGEAGGVALPMVASSIPALDGVSSAPPRFFTSGSPPAAFTAIPSSTPGGDVVASIVPEPPVWLQLILGFGIIGAIARQPRRVTKSGPWSKEVS